MSLQESDKLQIFQENQYKMIVEHIFDAVTDPEAVTNTHQYCPSGNCSFPILAILGSMNHTSLFPLADHSC